MYGVSVGIDCTDHGQWDAEWNKRNTIKVKQEANSLNPVDTLNTTVLLLLLTISVLTVPPVTANTDVNRNHLCKRICELLAM